MDQDLSNSSRMYVTDEYGRDFGPFNSGHLNYLRYNSPDNVTNAEKRATLSFLSNDKVHMYVSAKNLFLSYPIESLGTEHILSGSSMQNSTFYITPATADSEVYISFQNGDHSHVSVKNWDTIVLKASYDLTGTHVLSTNPIAVFSALEPYDTSLLCSSFFHLPYVSGWGINYSFTISPGMPFSFRIIAAYDDTSITVSSSMKYCANADFKFVLNAREFQDFHNYDSCFLIISSAYPFMTLVTEFSSPSTCNTMVIPSTNKAITGSIPVLLKSNPFGTNLRVWVSDADYLSLVVDGETPEWSVIKSTLVGGAVVETSTTSGYHVISSSSLTSRLLVTLNKELYGPHNLLTELSCCPDETIIYAGLELTFPSAIPGTTVNSAQTCGGESADEHPIARRICRYCYWKQPDLISCYSLEEGNEAIERIDNTTVTGENVVDVANDLVLVTVDADNLEATEVDIVAESLEEVVEANSTSPNVTESVIGTVNNIMEVDESDLENSEGSSTVVNTLEEQVSNVQKNPENFTDVQDNVGVKAVKVDPVVTKAMTFVNLPPDYVDENEDILNADLTEESTMLYNNENEVQSEDCISSIFIPAKILEHVKQGEY
ncbi:hypothetical protein BSL78_03098 [Apostichopus japonicus]|uniref:IgGFc-binding protein N-terminal domain-containing protein n=1 Tax=Stichopus japonicus TaxID=307972 RepID=A0A2G8LI64_STIJA|nr:hypothetical protein BSL78_03098 [Apostichopus japonicus]